MANGVWRALLEGAAQRRALDEVDRIADRLRGKADLGPTLAGGAAGVALFFAYLAEHTTDGEDTAAAVRFLEAATGGEPSTDAALFEGRTGVTWVLAHLDGRLLDLGSEDPNDAMDSAVLALLETQLDIHDLVSGLIGIGVYAMERLPRPAAWRALERVVSQLGNLAHDAGDGVGWFTPAEFLPPDPRRLSPDGHWDLGMAHGAAGIVAFLAHTRAPGADELLDQAVAWLLAQQLPPGSTSRFGSWLDPGQPEPPQPARTAWCYGDPGVAAALLAAGRRDEALDVATTAAQRPADETRVVDAGLCHGAAGLLHVFNRLHQGTDDEALAAAARRWFEAALVLPVHETGFLEGQAGVGLALLAAATDIEPAWDRVLLLSGP